MTRCDQESHSYSKVSRPARYGFLPRKVVELASGRDGATNRISLVRPKVPLSEGTAYNRLASVPNFPMRLEVGGTAGSLTLSRVRPSPADFFTPGR